MIFNNLPTGTKRFGDYFRVSHVVATLLNEAFVLEDGSYEEVKGGYLYKGFLLLIVTKGFFFRVVLYFFLLYIFFLPILLGEYFLDETFFLFKDN